VSSSGAHTQDQTIRVSNTGGGIFNWTATPSTPRITASPGNGTGAGTVTIGLDPTGLGAGGHHFSVSFAVPGAANSPQNLAVDVNVYNLNATSSPRGDFATPIHGTTGITGAIPVTGWTRSSSTGRGRTSRPDIRRFP
jgi:hypothetical protein